MRITCPSCTSHFEIPTELLGKKGRALKCASCGHAWYQSAQIEDLDLAAIMGEDYAAAQNAAAAPGKIRSEMSSAAAVAAAAKQRGAAPAGAPRAVGAQAGAQQRGVQAAALSGPREAVRAVAAPIGQRKAAPALGAPPLPAGAVSMMSRNQASPRNQRPAPPPQSLLQRNQPPAPGLAPGAPGAVGPGGRP